MEKFATEGQQNSVQSKQCLVFNLHFALLSSLRSRDGHCPSTKLAPYYSLEGHCSCGVKAAAMSKRRRFQFLCR